MISVMVFMHAIWTSTSLRAKFIAVLGMSSILTSAYSLLLIRKTRPQQSLRRPVFLPVNPNQNPVQKYLEYLNGIFSLLVALNVFSWRGRSGVYDGFWVVCLLPAGKFSGFGIMSRPLMADSGILRPRLCQEDHARGRSDRARRLEIQSEGGLGQFRGLEIRAKMYHLRQRSIVSFNKARVFSKC